jgi:hypothetical protein
MKDNTLERHLKEWEELLKTLEEIVETDERKEIPKHAIEYRIERIKSLIKSHEDDKQ